MGRGVTPTKFKDDFADRLRSARVAAGYASAREFAEAAGIPLENYKKYESGRTPMPHQYIRRACELIDKDANYLFNVAPKISRRSVAGTG